MKPSGERNRLADSDRRAGMRLSTRLFLLFLLSGAIPLALLSTAGWIFFKDQFRLMTVTSVEQALTASLDSNRVTLNRLRRTREDFGQDLMSSPRLREALADADSNSDALTDDRRSTIDRLTSQSIFENWMSHPAIDIIQYYTRDGDRWRLLAETVESDTELSDVGDELPEPAASAIGPQRSRPLRFTGSKGDIDAVPTYHWSNDGEPRLLGCLLVGTLLGQNFYADLEVASTGLTNYRRLQEIGEVLRIGNLILVGLVLLASLFVSFWLARRVARTVSRPVEGLVEAMDAVGKGEDPPIEVHSQIPEMESLSAAFSEMRQTLKEYELRLRESEQLRGAQTTARFVAHEIRNALTPVRAGLAVLEKRVAGLPAESQAPGRRALGAIRREAERMTTLAETFSEYAHLPEPEPEELDLVPLIRGLVENDIPEGVDCDVRLPESKVRLWADRDDMERLLRNLIKNSVEAMEGSGRIRIELEVDRKSEGRPEELVLVVADEGPGIDPRTLEQVMQPGFTTKESGSGLGLALARMSVSRYGGRLEIESELDHGTTVRLRFPNPSEES